MGESLKKLDRACGIKSSDLTYMQQSKEDKAETMFKK